MSLGRRIKERRELLGMSRKQLADFMGVTASAVANYENEISSPKAELLYPLMDALKCDANYLYQDETAALGGYPVNLTYDEHNHIKKYRVLDEHGKEIVDTNLEIEYKRCQDEKAKATAEAQRKAVQVAGGIEAAEEIEPEVVMKDMIVYLNPAAAGTPLFAEGDYDRLSFPEDKVPYNADCGVRISGHSMEPDIPNRSIVWVHQTPSIDSGEVGIFSIDGDVACKRFYQDGRGSIRLESDNPDYPPVDLREFTEVKLFGKVVGVLPPED